LTPGRYKPKRKWIDKEAMKSIKKKKQAWKKYTLCKDEQNYKNYTISRNKATGSCRTAKYKFEKKLALNINQDNKSFWSYVRSESKTKSSIGDLKDIDGTITSDEARKCEILNSFFASVFTNEDTTTMPTFNERNFSEELSKLEITELQVSNKLKSLDPSKSPGIDAIHPKILKECHEELAKPISTLFNKSLASGQLPNMWKLAQVTALFKKGDKKASSNYRPVSLTVVLCKILESFIRDSIVKHMERNNLFIENQHGFRSKRSCVTQLLEVIEEWTDILDRGGNIDCIYLDFAKAFDTVPHQRLLLKLNAYGVRGKIHEWISNFLNERKQQVRLGNSCSQWMDVKSGIPQGSVLGPILFLVFINDLPDVVCNITKLFADDTKIYKEISSENDAKSLQTDINSLEKWSERWQIKFNASKCKCMHLGKGNPEYCYKMGSDNATIEKTKEEKDLGVVFDNELRFTTHIQEKVKKANQTLGIIRNTFQCLDKEVFLPLYKTLIRPHLEYAAVIWKPHLKKDILAIENVQRRATKLVSGLSQLPYEQRMKRLGLPTLIYRRDRADMVNLFKIMHQYDVADIPNIKPSSKERTRGHSLKLEKNRIHTRYGAHRFSTRSVNVWNKLPEEAVAASSVNSFKSILNNVWKYKDNKFEVL